MNNMGNDYNHIPPGASLERLVSLFMAAMVRELIAPKATILVYHGIVDDAEPGLISDDSVRAGFLERQMRFLRESYFNVVSLGQLLSHLETGTVIPEKTVAVTFDDGYRDTFTRAFPILRRYNIPATVFLAAAFIGQPEPFPWLPSGSRNSIDARYPMSWENAKELNASGWEIGSHTNSHRFLPTLERRHIFEEISKSQEVLERKLGKEVRLFALPYSFPLVNPAWPSFDSILADALRERNFRCCCTMLRGHVTENMNPYALRRVPVGRFDDLKLFRAKLSGCYAWSRFPQYVYQAWFKKYPAGSDWNP